MLKYITHRYDSCNRDWFSNYRKLVSVTVVTFAYLFSLSERKDILTIEINKTV